MASTYSPPQNSNRITPTHNLDINTYSLEEIFNLFNLTYELDEVSMKSAKMKVLMLHPDKSNLPPTYFHFYKQAYDVILDIYRQKTKCSMPTQSTATTYKPLEKTEDTVRMQKQVASVTKEMKGNEFNSKFNDLYQQNMTKKIDDSRNAWFKSDEPASIDFSGKNVNPKNMDHHLKEIKRKQASIVVHRDFQEIKQQGFGTSYFEEDDEANGDSYIGCDIFSKLKFDDLRRVHKDQTVFAVSESDLVNKPQYKTVEQFVNERNKNTETPMTDTQSSRILVEQQRIREKENMDKQFRDKLLQKEFEEKNKNVMSAFLRLR